MKIQPDVRDGTVCHVGQVVGGTHVLTAVIALAVCCQGAVGFPWVSTGGPPGGLGYDVRIHPLETNVMYVTDAKAGVFMSTSSGQTWFPSNDGIVTRLGLSGDQIPIFCLTIDPHDPDIVWAGTQDKRGIYKSTDGGENWSKMDSGIPWENGITFRGFTVHPETSDIVYAAAELSSWIWAGEQRIGISFDMTQGAVFRSTNGGQDWQEIWRGDNLARYVWINPQDADVLYVSTGIFDREAANSVPRSQSPGGVGVVKSVDGGQTWAEVNEGLGNLYVGSLFMHPEDPDILLAGTGANPYRDESGVYLTIDGADSWEKTLDTDPHAVTSVEFAESDPDVAYAGTQHAIYRSDDGGHTWEMVSKGGNGWGTPDWQAGFPIDFQVDPSDPDRIFANNYGGGNLVSVNGGKTWSLASDGYTGAEMRDIAVVPGVPGHVWAAGRTGLFRSLEGGSNWQSQHYGGGEWMTVALDPTDSGHVLAAHTTDPQIQETQSGQEGWQSVGPSLGANLAWRTIVFAPSNPTVVYAGTGGWFFTSVFDDTRAGAGIYVSPDSGTTWNEANTSVTSDANVAALAVSHDSSGVVYAATTNRGVLKTTNGAREWIAVNGDLPGGPPVALAVAVHPENANLVYVGLAGAGLHLSDDGGESWAYVTGGLSAEAYISDIVIDPTETSTLYTSDRLTGVYRSIDGGETWELINEGLRIRDAMALALSSDGAHLYAATEGGGVFRLDLSGEPPPAASDEGEPEDEDGEEPGPEAGGAVVETSPANGATDVPPDAHIIITFDRPALVGSFESGVEPETGFTLAWSEEDRTVTVVPLAPLEPGVTYEVVIGALRFADGSELAEPFAFQFTTAAGDGSDEPDEDIGDETGDDDTSTETDAGTRTTSGGGRRGGLCGPGVIWLLAFLPGLALWKVRRRP